MRTNIVILLFLFLCSLTHAQYHLDYMQLTDSAFMENTHGRYFYCRNIPNDTVRWMYFHHGLKDKQWVSFFDNNIDSGIKVETYKKGKKHGEWLLYTRFRTNSGNYKNDKKHSKWVDYSPYISEEGYYKRGKRVGYWKIYNLPYYTYTGYYKNGLKEGLWEYYDKELDYLERIESYKKGLKDGKWIYYNEDNPKLIRRIEYYKADKPDGVWEYYTPISEEEVRIDMKVYYKDGELIEKEYIKKE